MAFRKRSNVRTIHGTMTSSYTGQVITSSGNESLDLLFGGGLPMGTILLIDEDLSMHYKLLVKYFLAEGLASSHDVFMASIDDYATNVMNELPAVISSSLLEPPNNDPDDIEMSAHTKELRICWRYGGLPLVKNEHSTARIGHQFDLSQKMNKSAARNSIIRLWTGTSENLPENSSNDSGESCAANCSVSEPECDARDNSQNEQNHSDMEVDIESEKSTPKVHAASENSTTTTTTTTEAQQNTQNDGTNGVSHHAAAKSGPFYNSEYQDLFEEIRRMATNERYTSLISVFRSFCRVVITSLGSPLWNNDHFEEDILKFLTILRALLHTSNTACIITMPMHLIRLQDKTLEQRILNLVEYAIEFQPFSTAQPFLDNYTGMLKIHKVTALNTLAPYKPETFDLVYRIRRSKLTIENLHLPPAIEDSTAAASSDGLKSDVNCNSNTKLDF